jgi:predicted nucleic acid-binding protein
MSKIFIDSNVIVYANDARDPAKRAAALDRLEQVMRDGAGVVSTQVLMEYAAVALSKLGQPADAVLRQLWALEALEVVQVSPGVIRRAVEIHLRTQISFWDASIIAAAEHANCGVVLSEDLNPGQLYAGVRVEDPFVGN